MTSRPKDPKIYHITPVDNLAAIIKSGELISEAERRARGVSWSSVGMANIKQRRLSEIEVSVHPETKVGEYVPFYFCPRSVMLYILHKGNHPNLEYSGGQKPIIHLEASLSAVINWADRNDIKWAFSDRNAGSYLVEFFNSVADLHKVAWSAVAANDFRDAQVKEGKQAEFLCHKTFPWTLVQQIGTYSKAEALQVQQLLRVCPHEPVVKVMRDWYF